jgi:predicted MPP superfamily phosphohydrolase
VLGNHDVWVDPKGATAALRGHGYEVLENAWTTVRLRGAPFTVVGVGDHRTGRDDVRRAVKGLAGPTPLVLAHGPRTAEKLERLNRPSLCLSGHTHGGQITSPSSRRSCSPPWSASHSCGAGTRSRVASSST